MRRLWELWPARSQGPSEPAPPKAPEGYWIEPIIKLLAHEEPHVEEDDGEISMDDGGLDTERLGSRPTYDTPSGDPLGTASTWKPTAKE
eukprot:3319283-Pyramimonas_sp.AAC.1